MYTIIDIILLLFKSIKYYLTEYIDTNNSSTLAKKALELSIKLLYIRFDSIFFSQEETLKKLSINDIFFLDNI